MCGGGGGGGRMEGWFTDIGESQAELYKASNPPLFQLPLPKTSHRWQRTLPSLTGPIPKPGEAMGVTASPVFLRGQEEVTCSPGQSKVARDSGQQNSTLS